MIRNIGFGRCAVVLFWVASVLLPGCNSSENLPECAPVSGKVTIGGEPLASAMVTFHPGTYILNTYGTHDGALVGKHTVTVERYLPPMPTQPGGKIPSAKATVPKKYTSPQTSPLKVEVKSGANNAIDLPLDNN